MLMLRQPAAQRVKRRRVVKPTPIPAPVGGWDAKSPLASMDPMRAVQLKNWFPQPGWVEVRRGYQRHAYNIGSDAQEITGVDTGTERVTIVGHGLANGTAVRVHAIGGALPGGLTERVYYVVGAGTNDLQLAKTVGGAAVNLTSAGSGTLYLSEQSGPAVETLAVWQGPTSRKMMAGAGGALWDVTASAAATLSHAAAAASNRWQWCMHTTSAGQYLFLVNGADDPLHFSGTTWAAPVITGITAADAVHVISHKRRLWFTLKDSTKGAYLGTEAVAGSASAFEFGGLFSRGGHLVALATWTRDGGSGADDYLVAISSRGQVALYQGTDPASANTWALVGVFDVPPPIGRRCFQKYGADLLLLTIEGVFPLAQLLSVDQSQTGRVAITDLISPRFAEDARLYSGNFGWEVAVYPRGTRLLVNVPTSELTRAYQPVMNTLTGSWCEFDGHQAVTWAVFGDELFFGAPDGLVYEADSGASDGGAQIVAVGQTAYSAFGAPNLKRFSMVRPLVTASSSTRLSLGISLDFIETSALSSGVSVAAGGAVSWDSARWDVDAWPNDLVESNDWASTIGIGTFGSVKFVCALDNPDGRAGWGDSEWGSAEWFGTLDRRDIVRLQGLVALVEPGEFL